MAVIELTHTYKEKFGKLRNMESIRVDTRNIDGLKKAEKLKENGWELCSSGFYILEFKREIKEKL